MTGRIVLLAGALCLVACSKDTKPPESGDDVFEAWRNAGLSVGMHESLEKHTLGEGDCERGIVDDIETTVCSYESEDAAREAQPAGLDLVGEVTGASLPRGRVLLVVADRNNKDPNGKKINAVTKTFLGR